MATICGGCLPISIETGRFQTPKVPLNDRLCINCNQHAIEDIPMLMIVILFKQNHITLFISLLLFVFVIFVTHKPMVAGQNICV